MDHNSEIIEVDTRFLLIHRRALLWEKKTCFCHIISYHLQISLQGNPEFPDESSIEQYGRCILYRGVTRSTFFWDICLLFSLKSAVIVNCWQIFCLTSDATNFADCLCLKLTTNKIKNRILIQSPSNMFSYIHVAYFFFLWNISRYKSYIGFFY